MLYVKYIIKYFVIDEIYIEYLYLKMMEIYIIIIIVF